MKRKIESPTENASRLDFEIESSTRQRYELEGQIERLRALLLEGSETGEKIDVHALTDQVFSLCERVARLTVNLQRLSEERAHIKGTILPQ